MFYPLGNGVETIRMYRINEKLYTKRRENFKKKIFSSVSH
jgi:hypothetical protein